VNAQYALIGVEPGAVIGHGGMILLAGREVAVGTAAGEGSVHDRVFVGHMKGPQRVADLVGNQRARQLVAAAGTRVVPQLDLTIDGPDERVTADFSLLVAEDVDDNPSGRAWTGLDARLDRFCRQLAGRPIRHRLRNRGHHAAKGLRLDRAAVLIGCADVNAGALRQSPNWLELGAFTGVAPELPLEVERKVAAIGKQIDGDIARAAFKPEVSLSGDMALRFDRDAKRAGRASEGDESPQATSPAAAKTVNACTTNRRHPRRCERIDVTSVLWPRAFKVPGELPTRPSAMVCVHSQ
jgi:hypothetical protein